MLKLSFFLFLFPLYAVHACTDFVIQAKDTAYVNGRSMEFGVDLSSSVVIHTRGEKITSTAPNNKEGIKWTSKYGYVAINAMDHDITVDGLNEEGLSFGALWLPDSQYPEVGGVDPQKIIALEDIGSWLLGNYKNVAEVKEAFTKIVVWAHPITWFQNSIPPLHFVLHDKEGKNLVIEFVGGQPKVHDNPLGVLTNDPPFEWQINNLRNYIKITAVDSEPVTLGPISLQPTGHGGGLFGIPGDWTPPSRFVRAAFFKTFASPMKDGVSAVLLASHILNTVDIPYGDIRDAGGSKSAGDYTQWVVIKDLMNKKLYYRSYYDLSLKAVDLTRIDFKEGSKHQIVRVNEGLGIIDITSKL